MAIIAFYLTDKNQHDLIVYREQYDTLLKEGIVGTMAYSAVDRSPLFIWIIYLMSYLEDNRFTSAIPTFVGYFILVFLLIQTSRLYGIKKSTQLAFLLFLMFVLPWQDYSIGIRGTLAYSLCSYGVYLDFRKQKKMWGYIFYVIPIFIHQASIIFIVLRLFVYLIRSFPFTKKYIYTFCLLAGSMTEFMGPMIEDLANLTGLRILSIVSMSFNSYTTEDKELYEISIVILRVSVVLIVYLATRKFSNRSMESSAESNIFSIYTMLMLIAIGFIWQYDIVCRYTVACMIFSTLIINRCNQRYIKAMVVLAIINLIRYYNSYYSKWEILFQ